MQFKHTKYYKPLVDELIIEFESKKTTFPQEKIRDIFSRGYYTILLHCRDVLNVDDCSSSSHDCIINAVCNTYTKRMLRVLKQDRVRADYKNNDFEKKYTEALSLKRNIEKILSFTEVELNKRK